MITRAKWTYTLVQLGKRMDKANTKYGWDKPISEPNTLRECTCVGFVASALQEVNLLPKGDYIHMENGKLLGSGWNDIKGHPERFEILHVNASPQKLGSKLQVGDICLYNVPHIMVYAGRNKSGTPIWYSLERGKGGMGKPAKLTIAATFGYYSKRKIDYVVRIKFAEAKKTTTVKKPTPAPAPVTKPKYKTLMAMNLRQSASSNSKKLGTLPKGITFVAEKVSGSWAYMNHANQKGWVCILPKYCKKV